MKVTSVKSVKLPEKVPTFDITVPETKNFQLASGPFVHNSKDVSDAVAGTVFMLQRKEASYGRPPRRARTSRAAEPSVRKVRFGSGRRIKG